jgi:ABC-type Zn uptake system ZnuABC Zn-binding protein ZnuA
MVIANVLAACLSSTPDNGKPTVVATIFPYYDIVRAIGGDKINAVILLEPHAEVHDFQATPADKAKIESAKLIVRNGLELDDWAIFNGAKAKMLVIGDGVGATLGSDHGNHKHANPHIWLDPTKQIKAAEMVRDALIEIDPNNKETYTKNAAAYTSQLVRLDADFAATAKELSKKSFIGFHDAYEYLAARYGISQVATVETADKTGLTPAQKEIVLKALGEKKASVIFAEDEESKKIVQSIFAGPGVTIDILLPLEHYRDTSDTYESLMRQNLETIKKAMK